MLPRAALPRPRRCRHEVRAWRALAGVCVLFVLALGGLMLSGGGSWREVLVASAPPLATQNSSGDPYGLCPSSGPVYLGVEWNCIAVLNLTVVCLLLGGIGIIAYVFRDSDAAEFPDESAEIPLTEEEWAEEQARRKELMAGSPARAPRERGDP